MMGIKHSVTKRSREKLFASEWNADHKVDGDINIAAGTSVSIGTTDNNDLSLKTNNTERIKIKANGNVGIGTQSPSEKLEINGAIKLGTTSNNNPGTIRWTGTDFEGYNGNSWVSLTGGGANNFIDLNDTPNSYSGQEGKIVKVKEDETGLEFSYETDPIWNSEKVNYFNKLTDTTDSITEGNINKFYSSSLFNQDFATKTTDDLEEGSINLYFKNERFDERFDIRFTTKSIGDLEDVNISSPQNGQAIVYDSSIGKWKNTTISSGGSCLWTDQGTYIYPNNYPNFVITDDGKVGIGTLSDCKLSVDGKIYTSGGVFINPRTAGPAEYRLYNLGFVAEWYIGQPSGTDHNLHFRKGVGNTFYDYMYLDTNGNLHLANSGYFGDIKRIKSVSYSFPSSQGAPGSVLTNDGSGNLSWQVLSSSSSVNLVDNGGFEIWQRGISFTNPPEGSYLADRWQLVEKGPVELNFARDIGEIGYCLKIEYPTFFADYRNIKIEQKIDVDPQLVRGKTLYLKAKVKAPFGDEWIPSCRIYIKDSLGESSAYNRTFGTWETLSVSRQIASNTTYLIVGFEITNMFDWELMGDNFYIDSFILSFQDSDFQPLPISEDLARCKRWYQVIEIDNVVGSDGTNLYYSVPLPVEMSDKGIFSIDLSNLSGWDDNGSTLKTLKITKSGTSAERVDGSVILKVE